MIVFFLCLHLLVFVFVSVLVWFCTLQKGKRLLQPKPKVCSEHHDIVA